MSLSYATAHHPAPAPLGIPNMGHRQCDNCGYAESTLSGRALSICAGCKFVAYCSKECQRAHWNSHKGVCRLTAATIGASRAQGSQGAGQYPTPNMAKYLRKFCSTHASLLAWVAYQALDLKHVPGNIRTKSVLIEIAYEPSAPLRFSLRGTHFVPRTYLSQYADPLIVEDVHRREERSRRAGGIGCAVVLLQCGNMAEVMPVEVDHPAKLTAWEVREDWEEVLEWYVSSGRGDFTPPLVTGISVRNYHY